MGFISGMDRIFNKIEEIILAVLLVGMVSLASLQVLLRNVWNTGIDWADVTLQNATVVLGLLGAAIATSEKRHLTIDVVSRLIKGRIKHLVQVVLDIFALGVCSLLTQGGIATFRIAYEDWRANIPEGWTVWANFKTQFLDGGFPEWLSQLFLPIGFGLIAFHFTLRLILDLGTLVKGASSEDSEKRILEGDAYLDELELRATSGDPQKGRAS